MTYFGTMLFWLCCPLIPQSYAQGLTQFPKRSRQEAYFISSQFLMTWQKHYYDAKIGLRCELLMSQNVVMQSYLMPRNLEYKQTLTPFDLDMRDAG